MEWIRKIPKKGSVFLLKVYKINPLLFVCFLMVVKKFKYLNRWYLWYLNVNIFLLLYKISSSSKILPETLLIIPCSVQCRFSAVGRWVAKLVAHLLSAAALRVRIQTSLKKIRNERHKERSSQHTLAHQKIYTKERFLAAFNEILRKLC